MLAEEEIGPRWAVNIRRQFAEGREQGREEGRLEGRQKGRASGMKKLEQFLIKNCSGDRDEAGARASLKTTLFRRNEGSVTFNFCKKLNIICSSVR